MNILAISLPSIAGTLIINGLVKGFEHLGNNTAICDVNNLSKDFIDRFNPDLIIGYGYGHLFKPEAEYIINNLEIPIIHYFADNPDSNYAHSGNKKLLEKLIKSQNIVFCWDRNHLNIFKGKAYYLPLGVDPDSYLVEDCNTKTCDIVFTGRPLTLGRLKVLSEVIKNYPDKLGIYCYEKHFLQSIDEIKKADLLDSKHIESYKKAYKGFLKTESELANVYVGSKICLNITLDQGVGSINYRVLEALVSGGFLLTDYKNDTVEFFKDGSDLATYRDSAELIEKISKYLKNDDLRARIARNGKEKVLKYHTFKHRAGEILSKI